MQRGKQAASDATGFAVRDKDRTVATAPAPLLELLLLPPPPPPPQQQQPPLVLVADPVIECPSHPRSLSVPVCVARPKGTLSQMISD